MACGSEARGNQRVERHPGRGPVTAAGPVRDSVLDALGYAIRVLTKPGYWWAPTLLTAIGVLPILALPGLPGMGGAGGFGGQPPFATQAEREAYFRAFVPIIVASVLLAIVLTPISTAFAYRLAVQFTNGEDPRPFGPGFVDLAWRFFLQTLAYLLLVFGGGLLIVVLFVLLASITSFGLAALVSVIAWVVAGIAFVVRLAIAPALLVSGAGPIESITRAWQMTRGRTWMVLRWVLVTALIVAIAASLLAAAVGAVFGAFGQTLLGSAVAAVVAGPFIVVDAIVLVMLARLLSGPVEPPPPPELPAWMSPSAPPEPPVPPSTAAGR